MDIELLFSKNPFVQQYSNQFSFIQPNGTQRVTLGGKKQKLSICPPNSTTKTYW